MNRVKESDLKNESEYLGYDTLGRTLLIRWWKLDDSEDGHFADGDGFTYSFREMKEVWSLPHQSANGR